MKSLLMVICLVMVLFVAGCAEFATGFATGSAAMQAMAIDAQKNFNESLAQLEAEKVEVDALIGQIEDADLKLYLQTFVDEQTIANIEKLQDANWNDPKVSIGYGLALLASITAGYQKYRRTQG